MNKRSYSKVRWTVQKEWLFGREAASSGSTLWYILVRLTKGSDGNNTFSLPK